MVSVLAESNARGERGKALLRLRFTAEDLLQVTFAGHPAPLMELGLAVAMLQRCDAPAVFGRWQQRLQHALPGRARPLLELIPPSGKGPLFLDPMSRGLEDGLDLVMSAPSSFVFSELERACTITGLPPTLWMRQLAKQEHAAWRVLGDALGAAHACLVEPAWARIRSGFDAEHAWRTRKLADLGVQVTLAGLTPRGRWRGTTLELDAVDTREFILNGRGLLLLPSMIWAGTPLVAPTADGPTLLIYSAITPLPLLDAPADADPLATLLGRTRAGALRLLTRAHTTTDIARALGVSPSSASEHATALRNARLITTRREGKVVWHACTPLGLDLLRAR
jgi:DNA-binding transcriptional ArsR family regulator